MSQWKQLACRFWLLSSSHCGFFCLNSPNEACLILILFFSTQLQSQLQIKIKRNLKSAIFSYLHHQHPTYTQEHLIRSRMMGGGQEEDEGMKRGRSLLHCASGTNILRHQSAAQGQDTLRHGLSNEGSTRPNPKHWTGCQLVLVIFSGWLTHKWTSAINQSYFILRHEVINISGFFFLTYEQTIHRE